MNKKEIVYKALCKASNTSTSTLASAFSISDPEPLATFCDSANPDLMACWFSINVINITQSERWGVRKGWMIERRGSKKRKNLVSRDNTSKLK